MINALFEEYPEALYIDGEYYKISTDFRRWIALNEAMLDKTLSEEEKGCIAMSLFKDEVPDDYNSAIISIAEFLQPFLSISFLLLNLSFPVRPF